jgi:hypothetical protein
MLEGQHLIMGSSDDVVTSLDHALYFIPKPRQVALEAFRAEAGKPLPLANLRPRYQQAATLERCVASLANAGIRVAAADVTSPDIALAPVRVVRALGKYMQPIHFGSRYHRLKEPKTRVVPQRPCGDRATPDRLTLCRFGCPPTARLSRRATTF